MEPSAPNPSAFSESAFSSAAFSTSQESTEPSDLKSSAQQPIADHMLGDEASKDDRLGFEPYVNAVAGFLTHKSTNTPLTLSIEGAWGSGKSSFMLQLQEALRTRGRGKIVTFNAWLYDTGEGVLAAFIEEFGAKLNRELSFTEKLRARFKLIWLRLSWQDSIETVRALLWLLASSYAAALILIHVLRGGVNPFANLLQNSGKVDESAIKIISVIGGIGGTLAVLIVLVNHLYDLFKSPTSLAIVKKSFFRPDYSSKLPFIHRVAEDFQRLVEAYAGKDAVYVFIDDLDRCESSRAAELIQALMSLTASSPRIALILGLDRDKIAAALATKQEKVLPYLYNVQPSEAYLHGMSYGHRFIEKFIQLPFRVPTAQKNGMKSMINPESAVAVETLPENLKSSRIIEIVTGEADSETLDKIIEMADFVFDHNPRNVKQFVNMFRLRAFIANETGLFRTDRATTNDLPLTLEQLGKFIALEMRWPQLVESQERVRRIEGAMRIRRDGGWGASPDAGDAITKEWLADQNLVKLLTFKFEQGKNSSLANVNFEKLLEVAPAARNGSGDRSEAWSLRSSSKAAAPPSFSKPEVATATSGDSDASSEALPKRPKRRSTSAAARKLK